MKMPCRITDTGPYEPSDPGPRPCAYIGQFEITVQADSEDEALELVRARLDGIDGDWDTIKRPEADHIMADEFTYYPLTDHLAEQLREAKREIELLKAMLAEVAE